MIRKLHIYLPFVSAGMKETSTYRVNWIFAVMGNILGCFVSFFIWRTVFLSSENSSLNGFTFPQMIVYIFLMFLTNTLIISGGTYDIAEEIRDGSIAMRMLKPISYNSTFLFQELGNKILTTCILVIPIIIGIEIARTYLLGVIQFSALNLLLYFFSCILAYLINFFFNICFGFIAFITKHLWGANMIKNCIVGFLSGAMIPFSFFPKAIENIFLFLPFASLNYTPVMVYMSFYKGMNVLYYLGLQLLWVLLFWGFSKLLWDFSIKRLSIQGG